MIGRSPGAWLRNQRNPFAFYDIASKVGIPFFIPSGICCDLCLWDDVEFPVFEFADSVFDDLMGTIAFEIVEDDLERSTYEMKFAVAFVKHSDTKFDTGVAVVANFCFVWLNVGSELYLFVFFYDHVCASLYCYVEVVEKVDNAVFSAPWLDDWGALFSCFVWMPHLIEANGSWVTCLVLYVWLSVCVDDFE